METNLQIIQTPEIEINQINEQEKELNGKAMASFIIACVSLLLNLLFFFAVGGLISGVVSLGLSTSAKGVTKKPEKIFRRIAFPLSVACIAHAGLLMITQIAIIVILIVKAFIEHGVI